MTLKASPHKPIITSNDYDLIDGQFASNSDAKALSVVDQEEEKLKQEIIVRRNNVDSAKIQKKSLKKLIRK